MHLSISPCPLPPPLLLLLGDGNGAKELCIWALLFLPDGTLVSGDGGGNVCFWDAVSGTQVAAFKQHSADVLQLAAAPDGTSVFAAGACA
jgi:U3 small nucleolar RNA-associated protein 4